jgi:CRISPR/Cas system CSM-associated protein Csm3 (group 7 of RAMP superfamily)
MKRRQLEIRFHESFHHGSGFGIAGLVDRAVLRDCDGMPYLAGSAIKGKFRHAALRLLLSKGQQPCEYGDSPQACSPCPLCRMFGSRLRRGVLIFSDAQPDPLLQNVLSTLHQAAPLFRSDSHIRPGVSLDRALGTARNQLLFSTETLPSFLVFQAVIAGDLDDELEQLLQDSALILTHFGAGGSRGLGRCDYALMEGR